MAARGVGGVQMKSMGCTGRDFGKIPGVARHTRFEVGDGSEIRF
jgi:hypothetical protein